jgi:hypothetical protein
MPDLAVPVELIYRLETLLIAEPPGDGGKFRMMVAEPDGEG